MVTVLIVTVSAALDEKEVNRCRVRVITILYQHKTNIKKILKHLEQNPNHCPKYHGPDLAPMYICDFLRLKSEFYNVTRRYELC